MLPGMAAHVRAFRDFPQKRTRVFAFAWETVPHPGNRTVVYKDRAISNMQGADSL
jgi:hypothetical protein